MNLLDLLAQTLISLDQFPGDAGCQVTLLHSASLGRLEVEPTALEQAVILLVRGAVRASTPGNRIVIHAERFTDDLTDQDWVEISVPSPAPITALRQTQVEMILERVGGRLDLEAGLGDGRCAYRIYMPCTRIVVPFPAPTRRFSL